MVAQLGLNTKLLLDSSPQVFEMDASTVFVSEIVNVVSPARRPIVTLNVNACDGTSAPCDKTRAK